MRLNEHPRLVAEISYFLGKVYLNVNWHKMRNARATAYDIFEHRLEVASSFDSIPSLLKKLCNGLDLQAPSIPPEVIEGLESQARLALKMIRSWPQYFVYKASQVSKALKKKKAQAEIISQIIDEINKKGLN